jgi:glycosyltransferase involved in cell wall biosynthesis
MLHIFGTPRSRGGQDCAQRIEAARASDIRIHYHGAVDEHDVVAHLRAVADLVLVPSEVMETGPQVVLEAFSAGVPVIGSALGGITEWVEDDVNGRLLPAGLPAAWAGALLAIHKCPSTLHAWRRMVRQPRSMSDVAQQMMAVYAQLRAQSTKDRASVTIDSFYHHSSLQRRPFPS